MSSADPCKGLAVVAGELAELDARRAELMAERDILLVEARDNGVSWSELGSVSGLSVGAVKKALDRGRENFSGA